MGIMGDILDVTADGGRGGVIVSAISRKANLSHYAVLDKCESWWSHCICNLSQSQPISLCSTRQM
jgi:hypothetical protein